MSSNLVKLLAKAVDSILISQNKNRSDLAKMMNTTPQAISRYLAGDHSPGIDKLEAIAGALGVEPFELLMTTEERSKWKGTQEPPRIFPNVFDNIGKLDERIKQLVDERLKEKEAAAADPSHVPLYGSDEEIRARGRELLDQKKKKRKKSGTDDS